MTKEELWQFFCQKNPRFETSGAHFTAAGLRKFFDTTYQQAEKQAFDRAASLALQDDMLAPRSPTTPSTAQSYPTGLSVRQLKQIVNQWPETDAGGGETELWIRTEVDAYSPVTVVISLDPQQEGTNNDAVLINDTVLLLEGRPIKDRRED